MGIHRCTEMTKTPQDADSVFFVGLNEHIEITCGPEHSVNGEGVGTNDNEARTCLLERFEEIEEILGERGCSHGRGRRIRPGMESRV